MVFLMRVKLRSGRTKTFCVKIKPSNHHVWSGAKQRLNLNPNVRSCTFVPL